MTARAKLPLRSGLNQNARRSSCAPSNGWFVNFVGIFIFLAFYLNRWWNHRVCRETSPSCLTWEKKSHTDSLILPPASALMDHDVNGRRTWTIAQRTLSLKATQKKKTIRNPRHIQRNNFSTLIWSVVGHRPIRKKNRDPLVVVCRSTLFRVFDFSSFEWGARLLF